LNTRDYLTLLRESKLLIGACLVLCLLGAAGITVALPKQYASQVTFYVVANASTRAEAAASDNFQAAQLSTGRVKSYVELITGPRVAADAARIVGDGITADEVQRKVSADSVAETVIITMKATDPSPGRATRIASAVSDAFLKLVAPLETAPGPDQQPAVTAQIIQPPSIPGAAVSPLPRINMLIGLLLGLLLGVGLAIARRALNDSIRSTDDLQAVAQATVLGLVPQDRSAAQHPISLFHAAGTGRMTDARTEAYRRIRTNLEMSEDDRSRRVLVVTSALPEDGRTITACNLAAALAAVGSRVVLVDGDLRRPKVSKYLNIEQGPGLAGVLSGHVTLDAALQRARLTGFDVLASGGASPLANELVSSRRAGDVIDELRSRYQFVIIDTPPILPVADAAGLGANADGAVLVARWGKSRKGHLEDAVASLHAVSVPVIGAVLSRVPRKQVQTWSYAIDATRAAAPGGAYRSVLTDSESVLTTEFPVTTIPATTIPDDAEVADAAALERTTRPGRISVPQARKPGPAGRLSPSPVPSPTVSSGGAQAADAGAGPRGRD
jgi:capsular exopolysaccharide synthesis family protein